MKYHILEITLQPYYNFKTNVKTKTCLTNDNINDAKRINIKKGAPYCILDCKTVPTKNIISFFVDGYIISEISITCIDCNQKVKSRGLLKFSE